MLARYLQDHQITEKALCGSDNVPSGGGCSAERTNNMQQFLAAVEGQLDQK
jgi:hypothetical protein